MLFNVDRGKTILSDHRLAHENSILKVAAFPGQESHHNILAQGQLAVMGRGAVGQYFADLYALAALHDGVLVDARALVGAVVFAQVVDARAVFAHDDDLVAGNANDFAFLIGQDDLTRVQGRLQLHARADQRHVRLQ